MEYALSRQFETAYQSALQQALEILPDSGTEGHPDFEAVRDLVQRLRKSAPQFFDDPQYPVLIARMILGNRRNSAWEQWNSESHGNTAISDHPDVFHAWYQHDLPSIREQEWVNREFILECSIARELFPDCTNLESALATEIFSYLNRNAEFLRGICGKSVVAVAALRAAKLGLRPAVYGASDDPIFLPS